MIDRKALLVCLAEEGQLTPERSLSIREISEEEILNQVKSWGLTSSKVLKLAGVEVQPKKRRSASFKDEVEANLATFLILRGLSGQVVWVSDPIARSASLSTEWTDLLTQPAPSWCLGTYSLQTSLIFAMMKEPGWEYMRTLLENNVLPYGLDIQGRFLLVDGKTL